MRLLEWDRREKEVKRKREGGREKGREKGGRKERDIVTIGGGQKEGRRINYETYSSCWDLSSTSRLGYCLLWKT